MIADLPTDRGGLQRCVRAVRELDLEPRPDLDGKVYRFRRDADGASVDLMAPDHMTSSRATGLSSSPSRTCSVRWC